MSTEKAPDRGDGRGPSTNPTPCTIEYCAADGGDGITCGSYEGHDGPHWSSVWDLGGVGIYRQTWSDYRPRCPYVSTPEIDGSHSSAMRGGGRE